MGEPLRPAQKVGWALGPALFGAAVLGPTPESMALAAAAAGAAPLAPQVALGTLLWVLVWWVTEPLPLGVSTLVVPLVFGIAGILPWRTMLSSYTDPILWIFAAGFALAAVFQKWGLSQRVALRLATVYKGSDPRLAALFVACLPVFFLTVMGSITASASIVIPFASAYLAMLGLKPGSRYGTGVMLALGQAATAGAMLLLISTAPNLVAKATVAEYAPGNELTFGDWLLVGTPLAFAGLAISWWVTFRVVRPEMDKVEIDRRALEDKARALGPMSRGEWTAVGVLSVTVALWVLPSALRALTEFDPSVGPLASQAALALPEAMPAVLALFLLHAVRVEREPLLKWDEFVRGVDWNILFLFGGGIALGIGLVASGFAGWLAGGVTAVTGPSPGAWTIFAVAALIGFALTYAASNTAAAIIACPLAATLAIGAGLNPIPAILAAGLASSISSALPSTTPPMALVHSSGFVRMADMVKVGVVADLLRLALLIAVGPYLASLIT